MEWYILAIIIFSGLVLLLLSGMPLGFALGFLGIAGLLIVRGPAGLVMVSSLIWDHGISWTLTCLPLFILMAEVMVFTGIGADAFKAAFNWLGPIPGGVNIATIIACAFFAAVCGTSTAAAIAIGVLAIPQMMGLGVRKDFATGTLAAGGTLGILIPPSAIMIIYGSLTDTSVGHLFIAGIVPGIMFVLIFSIYILVRVLKNPGIAPRPKGVSWIERFSSLKGIIGLLLVMALVFGTLYGGICTPTEVAGIGAFASIIVALIYNKLNWSRLRESIVRTVQTTAFVLFIIYGAMIFTNFVAFVGVSDAIATAIMGSGLSPLGVLILVFGLYLVLGCMLDPMGMMVLTLPFIFPPVVALGFDPVWFGITITILCEMAYITPPFGFNLFVIKGISPPEVSTGDIIRGGMPFVGLMIMGIALLTAFPGIALWLPATMR